MAGETDQTIEDPLRITGSEDGSARRNPFQWFAEKRSTVTGPSVIIAGSRSFSECLSREGLVIFVASVMRCVREEHGLDPAEILSGGAVGVDRAGEVYAERSGLPVVRCPVEPHHWRELGARAGPLRNKAMAAYADALVAIWDGESNGTRWMLEYGEELLGSENVYPYTFPDLV